MGFCTCDACNARLGTPGTPAYRDALCEFCAQGCFPEYHNGRKSARICMAREDRIERHRVSVPVATALAPAQHMGLVTNRVMDEVRQAVERAVIEDGIPMVQKAARDFAIQWLSKHLKVSVPSRRP